MRGTTEQLDDIRKSRKFYTWRTESSSDVASLPWLSTEACWDEEDDGKKRCVEALRNKQIHHVGLMDQRTSMRWTSETCLARLYIQQYLFPCN